MPKPLTIIALNLGLIISPSSLGLAIPVCIIIFTDTLPLTSLMTGIGILTTPPLIPVGTLLLGFLAHFVSLLQLLLHFNLL